jgi:hypothetical protein
MDLEELKKDHDELVKTVIAIGDAAKESRTKTAAEIIEMKEKIAEDDKARRGRKVTDAAIFAGDEESGEFQRFDARDKLHPLTRCMESRRPIIRTAAGKDTPLDEIKMEFHAACDEFNILRAFYESKNGEKIRSVKALAEFAPQTCRKIEHYANILLRTTGSGMDTITELASWIPVGWSQSMKELERTASVLGDIFPPIQMNTAVYNWPLEGGDLTAYLCAQSTGDQTTGDTDIVPCP